MPDKPTCDRCHGRHNEGNAYECREVLLADVKRLRAELELAIGLLGDRSRIAWGWNQDEMRHGYYINGKWWEVRLGDAISKAAEAGEE